LQSVTVKAFFEIRQYLAKIWTKVSWHIFMAQGVVVFNV